MFIFLTPLVFIIINDFDITIKITLITETLLISLLSFYYLYYDRPNISNSIIIVFFFLFFVVAPTIQLGEKPIFLINTLPYDENNSFYINCLVIVFLISYMLAYVRMNETVELELTLHFNQSTGRLFTLNLLMITSIVAAYVAFNEISEIISALDFGPEEEESTSVALLRKKILYNVPIACMLYLSTVKFRKNKYKIVYIFLILILIIITKNPIIERRSGLGPTYLMLLYIFIPKVFDTNSKILVTFILIFVILFPLSAIFTNTSYSTWTESTWQNLGKISFSKTIYGHFNSLHYDAWANVDSAVRFTTGYGYQYGLQLMGVVFFFVPRAIWPDKPIATGHLVGEFLKNDFTMWFDNLSSPIIAEGYVDFGIFGVVLFGIVLAMVAHRINTISYKHDKLKKYTAIYVAFSLMFVLRGSLMSSYSYICGSIFTFVYLPKLIDFGYNLIFRSLVSNKISIENTNEP